jgi:virginiamycin B lyase
MTHRSSVIGLALLLTATGCEPAAAPTTPIDPTLPLFAAGPAVRFKPFRVPTDNSNPRHLALGSDGSMWFTESELDVSQIARIDTDGNITEFVVPTRFSQPSDIVAGPDGALWYTAPSGFPGAFIGRVTTQGEFTEFGPECDFGCSIAPGAITSGPDGNIWFTEGITNSIGKLTLATGEFTFYPIPTPDAGPGGITVGADGALWFTEFFGNKIGRIDVLGNITEFGSTIGPSRITAGPDGTLWFTAPFENKIGRLTIATGAIAEFALPTPSQPRDIVLGPDGNLWFTEFNAEAVSQITPDGVITRAQRTRGGPWGIARGAGDTIWIALMTGNKVARLTLTP